MGFDPIRVPVGNTIGSPELARRLAYQLQLPATTYGARLLKVYREVIEDALLHGEGINLGTCIIKLNEYDTRHIPDSMIGGGQKRARMYTYQLSTTQTGTKALEELTRENFD